MTPNILMSEKYCIITEGDTLSYSDNMAGPASFSSILCLTWAMKRYLWFACLCLQVEIIWMFISVFCWTVLYTSSNSIYLPFFSLNK